MLDGVRLRFEWLERLVYILRAGPVPVRGALIDLAIEHNELGLDVGHCSTVIR
jgi:hypothetical protein